MSKAFKKQPVQSSSAVVETPYLRAKQEWDKRIGTTQVQAKNWRLLAIFATLIALFALVIALITMTTSKNIVYVAEITKAGHVVNVAPLETRYRVTETQEMYFVGNFVKLIRSLPLDPVVAKQNMMEAYDFLTRRGSQQLNKFLQKYNYLKWLGKKTITVHITDVTPISPHTYHVGWTETTIGSDGLQESVKSFDGVFTLIIKPPTAKKAILTNPLGIYITDFNISSRDNNNEK